MAKRSKRASLVQTRKAPLKIDSYFKKKGTVKERSTKGSQDKPPKFPKVPIGYGNVKNPHGLVLTGVNETKQKRMTKAKLGMVSDAPEENKNQRLELRLTKHQKEVISKAAVVSGFKNISEYILHLAVNDSKNVIREQQIFELSERDRISFMETLENPPAPGENLRKAMANYLSFQEGR